MESNFDMFNHILEVVQKKEQKMIFYKPSQSLIKSSFETRSREPSQCVLELGRQLPNQFLEELRCKDQVCQPTL